MNTSIVVPPSSPLANLAFPRTGKRGVPQQFPRRLYEMLEGETKRMEANPATYKQVICWGASGTAFRIFDVAEFAETVLPKYFRTKKFSSFQRNLNLYGFTKVRRGPETDMYSHPWFLRNQPAALLKLRKVSAAARRQRLLSEDSVIVTHTRTVSPSFSTDSPRCSPRVIVPIDSGDDSSTASSKAADNRGRLDLLALVIERECMNM